MFRQLKRKLLACDDDIYICRGFDFLEILNIHLQEHSPNCLLWHIKGQVKQGLSEWSSVILVWSCSVFEDSKRGVKISVTKIFQTIF